MPELPEVETVVRTLERQIKDKEIKDVEVFWNNIIIGDVEKFKRTLIGKRFLSFNRLGKYIYFGLSDDLFLISHLRMEGKYFLKKKEDIKEKHEHIIFHFSDETDLRYHDTRKFGKMELKKKAELFSTPPLSLLGPDANKLEFNDLKERFIHNNHKIKEVILDQNVVAGIGNIYADEILFSCRVHPERLASSLSDKEIKDFVKYSKQILDEAILAGGTTIRSYTSSLGVTGLFQQELLVHTKKECPICHSKILTMKVGGRTSYYCPNCQK